MEHLLNEQMEANKKLPKNLKYNETFYVAKLCAKYLKNTLNQMFKGFSLQLRDGLSLKVLDLLCNPSSYELKKIVVEETSKEDSSSDLSETSSSPSPITSPVKPSFRPSSTSSITGSSFPGSNSKGSTLKESSTEGSLREVPVHLQESMQLVCLVKEMPVYVACLFYCGSEWIFGRAGMETFKKQAHLFIVKNHWCGNYGMQS